MDYLCCEKCRTVLNPSDIEGSPYANVRPHKKCGGTTRFIGCRVSGDVFEVF